MRVLVLGGTGLISTAIVRRLLEQGHHPILFNRGRSERRFSDDLELIQGDRQDFAAFEATMAGQKFDAVIDMITFNAATAESGIRTFSGKVQHYLFCSTVCVYGGPLTTIPALEDEPHKPTGEYGANKSEAEAVFVRAYRETGFPVTMFRPSHCYGPGQPLLDIWGYNPALVNRIRQGLPIIVPGDGMGLWQPGHVSDVAKGFVGALGREATVGRAYNNVGDEVMDWRAFHERMAKAIGHEANIVTMTTDQILAGAPPDQTWMLREIFQYHAAYSNAALKRDVPDFRDLMAWEDGVRDTVAWLDETNGHQAPDTQPWITALADAERAFRASLGTSAR